MEENNNRQNILKTVVDQRNGVYGFAIFTLMVILILAIGAIRPTVITISRVRDEIETKKYIKSQLDSKIENITSLNTQYEAIKKDAIDLPLMFPSQGDFSLVLVNIDEICKKNGFKLSNIGFDAGEPLEDLSVVTLKPWNGNISVSGDKANLIDLLEDIENMPMAPYIEAVSFNPKTTEEAAFSATIIIRLYVVDNPNFYLE